MKTQGFKWMLSLLCAVSVGLTVSACSDDGESDPLTPTDGCDNSDDCAIGEICQDGVCEKESPPAGDECKAETDCAEGEDCIDGTCKPEDATAAECGNGIVEEGETCDDGEENGAPNQCNDTCDGTTAAECGNGIVEAGEECDEGEPTDTCDDMCRLIDNQPTAFRITEAVVIDPHLYFKVPIFGCNNVTNEGVAGNLPGGVNGMLKEALELTDEDDDDIFDMSIALLARPLTKVANAVFDAELRLPTCTTDHATCADDPTQPIVYTTATNVESGECFPASDHQGRNLDYEGLNNPTGPCFKSEPSDVLFSFGDIELQLFDASVAAQYKVDGDTGEELLVDGILAGFMPRDIADNTFIEIDAALVGGTYAISEFLRGGGGCGSGDDSDVYEGEEGWWMYLNFEAREVNTWTE